MNTMATGHREVMVRTPMNGLIQIAEPVISSWKKKKNASCANRLQFRDEAGKEKKLTSERSKLPFVHSTMEKTLSTVFRMAYCSAPNFSRNSMPLQTDKISGWALNAIADDESDQNAQRRYRDMGTRGKHRQQQQQGPVVILKGFPEKRFRNASLPPNSSISRASTL